MDIKSFIISIIATIAIPGLNLMHNLMSSRQNVGWRCKRLPSSEDLYLNWMFIINIMGGVLTICVLCIVVLIQELLNFNLDDNKVHLVCTCVIGAISVLTFAKKKPIKDWVLSSKYNTKKWSLAAVRILDRLLIVTAGIIWTFSLSLTRIAIFTAYVGCIGLEILSFVLLDTASQPEYKYISFLLDDGYSINDVEVTTIKQKWGWLTIKRGKSDVRFRASSIKRIEYSNVELALETREEVVKVGIRVEKMTENPVFIEEKRESGGSESEQISDAEVKNQA